MFALGSGGLYFCTIRSTVLRQPELAEMRKLRQTGSIAFTSRHNSGTAKFDRARGHLRCGQSDD